jgi:hypothetical protein
MGALFRPADWQPEVARAAPVALPEHVGPAALAAALLSMPRL